MGTYTENKRKSNKKWDDANLKTCTVRMYKDMYTEFEKYCIDNNISKNAMINKCIADAIGYTATTGKDVDKQN